MEDTKDMDSLDPNELGGEDKTLDKNETDPLNDIPDDGSDDTSGDKSNKDKDDKDKDVQEKSSSEIAQKIKYREKLKARETEIERLKEENERLRGGDSKPQAGGDDKEAQAHRFIKGIATEAVTEVLSKQKEAEEKAVSDFEDKLDVAVSKSEFSESQILDVCDSFDVEPATAVSILTRYKDQGKKDKPKIPQSKYGYDSSNEGNKKIDDSKRSMYDIASDLKKNLFGKK